MRHYTAKQAKPVFLLLPEMMGENISVEIEQILSFWDLTEHHDSVELR